ncbi:MAG: ATP-binding protein [Planctomycetota bacterium]|jgi:anti-sigma regulatory factor (Ser/Thr protein kinase)|nr:ATP-binding protein [Planctomycetota bacterium]
MANPLTTRREGDCFRFFLTLEEPAAAPEDAARLSGLLAPFLDEKRVEAFAAAAIHTALEELLTNLGKFGRPASGAPPEPASLTAEGEIMVNAPGTVLRLIDNGIEFNPALRPPPVFPDNPEQLVPGGLGLHMLQTMFSSFSHSRENGKNVGVWTIR